MRIFVATWVCGWALLKEQMLEVLSINSRDEQNTHQEQNFLENRTACSCFWRCCTFTVTLVSCLTSDSLSYFSRELNQWRPCWSSFRKQSEVHWEKKRPSPLVSAFHPGVSSDRAPHGCLWYWHQHSSTGACPSSTRVLRCRVRGVMGTRRAAAALPAVWGELGACRPHWTGGGHGLMVLQGWDFAGQGGGQRANFWEGAKHSTKKHQNEMGEEGVLVWFWKFSVGSSPRFLYVHMS